MWLLNAIEKGLDVLRLAKSKGVIMVRTKMAFTLTELLVVVVIVSIIAAFVIPGYQKSQARADERIVVTNIRMMATAMQLYKDRNGEWPPYPNESMFIQQINAVFNLSIIEDGNTITYTCGDDNAPPAGDSFECEANTTYGWQIETDTGDDNPIGVVFCDTDHGPCLSCTSSGCPL